MRTLATIALTGILSGCASLAPPTSISSADYARVTPAQQASQKIQEALADHPDIAHVLSCETPGAKRVLVNLPQSHFLEPYVIDTSTPEGIQELERKRKAYRNINNVQRRIHNALLRIADATDTRVVLIEGMTEIPALENVAKEYYRILDTLNRHRYIDAPAPVEKNSTFADINEELPSRFPFDNLFWPSYGFIPSAAYLPALNRVIRLFPADTRESEMRAYAAKHEAIANNDPRPWDRVEIMDDREDGVLVRATQVPTPVSIVIYGLGHAFGGKRTCGDTYMDPRKSYRDNIAEWNAQHPDEKFSLLEITVKGLPITGHKTSQP